MPQEFDLTERIIGITARSVEEGEEATIINREALTSLDGDMLNSRLEGLHDALFYQIPNLPLPSQIDHLLVTIAPDLKATAYINELKPIAKIRLGRDVEANEPIFVNDILELTSYDLGIPVPNNHGVVVIRSHGWRRALFYDFGPLQSDTHTRNFDLSTVLAEQTLTLYTGKYRVRPPVSTLRLSLMELKNLLDKQCKEESRYQELLERYPWLLGGQHTMIERHTKLDEANIPDFTGVRAIDGKRDIFEIKQPFLKCFTTSGEFNAEFHRAWDQAERYLTFVRNNRPYLHLQKNLDFSNPKCFLLIGANLEDLQLRKFHEKEAHNPSISLLTYNQVLQLGYSLLALVEKATDQ